MSGHINPGESWEVEQEARYQAMVDRIQRNNASRLPTNSLYGSSAPSIIDSTQHTFSAVPSQRLYGGSNTNSISQFPAEVNANALSNAGPSTYQSSNISEFRMPQSTKQFRDFLDNKSIIDQAVNTLRHIDRSGQKLVRRIFVHSLRVVSENQTGNLQTNASALLDQICNYLKANYYSTHIPESISGSSLMSDRTLNYHQHPRVVLNRYNPQSTSNVTIAQNSRPRSALSVNTTTTTAFQGHQRPPISNPQADINSILEESQVCLFDNSMLQHQRDERAAQQHQPPPLADTFALPKAKPARAKPTPKPKPTTSRATKTSAERAKKANISNALTGKTANLDTIVNDTPLPAGIKAMSRTGRLIKSPVKFYKVNQTTADDRRLQPKSKPGELENIINSILNDSMTLRNNKIVDKKTPPLMSEKGKKKGSPLITLFESDSEGSGKKPAAKKKANKENKENSSAPKSKGTKKQTSGVKNTPKPKSSKETTSKVTKNKKDDSVSLVKAKASKKVAQKRKSTGDDETTIKKKKIEEMKQQQQNQFDDDLDSDDELFGITYRKTTQSTVTAASPSAGLMSVKRAAARVVCKETPPCKAMGTMMNLSTLSAQSSASAVKEVPVTKPSQVEKRVAKTLQKGKTNTKPGRGRPKKAERKEDMDLQKLLEEAVKSTYPMATPTTAVKYTNMKFGEKLVTEDGDSDSGDDGDDDSDYDLL